LRSPWPARPTVAPVIWPESVKELRSGCSPVRGRDGTRQPEQLSHHPVDGSPCPESMPRSRTASASLGRSSRGTSRAAPRSPTSGSLASALALSSPASTSTRRARTFPTRARRFGRCERRRPAPAVGSESRRPVCGTDQTDSPLFAGSPPTPRVQRWRPPQTPAVSPAPPLPRLSNDRLMVIRDDAAEAARAKGRRLPPRSRFQEKAKPSS